MTTAPAASTDAPTALAPADPAPLQPLLSDAVIVLRAPTQVWSDRDGAVGTAAVHGIYHGTSDMSGR